MTPTADLGSVIQAEIDRLTEPWPSDVWKPRWWEIRRKAWIRGAQTARLICAGNLAQALVQALGPNDSFGLGQEGSE